MFCFPFPRSGFENDAQIVQQDIEAGRYGRRNQDDDGESPSHPRIRDSEIEIDVFEQMEEIPNEGQYGAPHRNREHDRAVAIKRQAHAEEGDRA